LIFQLPDRSRQCRLRHAAFFGCATKMLLIRQRDEEFQLFDHPTLPQEKS